MSGWRPDRLEPETRAAILAQPANPDDPNLRLCGCRPAPDGVSVRWWLCEFHAGFDEGVTAVKDRDR